MQSKIYTSFDDINYDLEILKLEKKLSYEKMVLSLEKTKENLQPHYIKREIIHYIKERISQSYRSLLAFGIPYILKYIKSKRG